MITAQIEDYSKVIEEMKPLFYDHWQELGIYKEQMPLDPEWEEYVRFESIGALLVATLRDDGKVVGYFTGLITRGLHYASTVQCKMDIAYICPEYRDAGNGKLLFDTVKQELKRRNVQLWWVGSKDHHPIEKFYESLGFIRQETHFTLWLE